MTDTSPVRVAIVGAGGMMRSHLRTMLRRPDTCVAAIAEPDARQVEATAALFVEYGLTPPPVWPDAQRLLDAARGSFDVAFIATPHANHHDETIACLECGLDVLLEKPMVVTAAEAHSLITARDRTGRLLSVAFQGSLSPQIRMAVRMLRGGELGPILNIAATTWQNWGPGTVGTWRQRPALSGGGFLFDTGAHMLNTVSDLAGEDYAEVAAWLHNNGRPVDTTGVVMARLKSGALVTMNGCGETIPSCSSEIYVFCQDGILRTGQWGERLEMQRRGEAGLTPVPVPESSGPWEQFLAVRSGQIANPSPPEVGLRMAKLWDAIRLSASRNGQPVSVG
ncbi:MAG: Gfo/Idh/MocA family oxidoreductase [Anaerolineae bacterium]|nr:Gfo/Idh/MocA family oxidoreductase [Anaerolineae bacterium]